MNAQETGTRILADLADDYVVETAARLVAAGKAQWVFDPEVLGVVGLVKPGTRRALVVVYVDDEDFETSAEFDTEIDKS